MNLGKAKGGSCGVKISHRGKSKNNLVDNLEPHFLPYLAETLSEYVSLMVSEFAEG